MMRSRAWRLLVSGLLLTTLTVLGQTAAPLSAASPASGRYQGETHERACERDTRPGYASCEVLKRTDAAAIAAGRALDALTVPGGVTPASRPSRAAIEPFVGSCVSGQCGYDPSYLQSAYNAPSGSQGTGQLVAIVDAGDDPDAEADLAAYRSTWNLPACTTANGCFRKVNQQGVQGSYPPTKNGWPLEISLDVDMVSALCPNCSILLVEASSDSLDDLGTSVNQAASMGAVAISNSYGGGEYSGETSADTQYFHHPGIAVTVSSGDNGYGVEYPAASPYVTAVGGTSLVQATNTGSRNATETVWSGAGSGCSAYEPKPTWQTDTGCANRTVADVSAVADPNTGVWVYDSFTGGTWTLVGGTSVASPIVAAMYALAGNSTSSSAQLNADPYGAPSALNDVTSGSNGSCSPSYLCTGVAGYDGPTGLGTPNGLTAFMTTPDFSLAATPASNSITAGSSAAYTVNLAEIDGFSTPVALTVTSTLPTGMTANVPAAPVTPTYGVGTSTGLTLLTTAQTPAGTYNVTVQGTGGGKTHQATVSLTVAGAATTPTSSPTVAPTSTATTVPTSSGTSTPTSTPGPTSTPSPTKTPSPTPTAAPVACVPRPPVSVSSAGSGAGTLSVTVSAGTNANTPTNRLSSLTFAAPVNSSVDAGGQLAQTTGFSVSLPAGTTQTSFQVHRLVAGSPATVSFTAVDTCGAWPSFVGGGAAAF